MLLPVGPEQCPLFHETREMSAPLQYYLRSACPSHMTWEVSAHPPNRIEKCLPLPYMICTVFPLHHVIWVTCDPRTFCFCNLQSSWDMWIVPAL